MCYFCKNCVLFFNLFLKLLFAKEQKFIASKKLCLCDKIKKLFTFLRLIDSCLSLLGTVFRGSIFCDLGCFDYIVLPQLFTQFVFNMLENLSDILLSYHLI